MKPPLPQSSVPPSVSSQVGGDGGLQFRDAKAFLATVVDNGVDPDDSRVLVRTNEATKIIMDTMIPVGGMAIYLVQVSAGGFLILPPQLENCVEAFVHNTGNPNPPGEIAGTPTVFGDPDITQSWYEIVNNSVYLDPTKHHDNPLIDFGLIPDQDDASILHRVYQYPGLAPGNSVIQVTGKKRYLPLKDDDDYLIVQNLEALKLIIISIERNENGNPDDAQKYRQQAFEILQTEVKNHILDPVNYMRRKTLYWEDTVTFPVNTLGWMRGNMALDVDEALKSMGKQDLTWTINQIERRIMGNGIYKDMVINIRTGIKGGYVYLPFNVLAVLAMDLNGRPIPIRSQFFQMLENGPGMSVCHEMLIDQGDEMVDGVQMRKYKLEACPQPCQIMNAVCLLRWVPKLPGDLMTIKNYEAIRLMFTAKVMEEKEQWQQAAANQQQAFSILDKELQNYLAGIRHTVHVQTDGFGLGDVGNYWTL